MTSQEWQQRADANWRSAELVEVRSIAQRMLECGARFEAFVITQNKAGELRAIWHWDLKGKLFSVECKAPRDLSLPSIADIYCGADWAEREARDYYGVSFEGRVSTAPLMLREGDAPGVMLRPVGGPK
jgi:NADH:ubiquinone oxidoreductase subunit C